MFKYLPDFLEFLCLLQINTTINATIIVAMTTMMATSGPAITPIFPARIRIEINPINFNKAMIIRTFACFLVGSNIHIWIQG